MSNDTYYLLKKDDNGRAFPEDGMTDHNSNWAYLQFRKKYGVDIMRYKQYRGYANIKFFKYKDGDYVHPLFYNHILVRVVKSRREMVPLFLLTYGHRIVLTTNTMNF